MGSIFIEIFEAKVLYASDLPPWYTYQGNTVISTKIGLFPSLVELLYSNINIAAKMRRKKKHLEVSTHLFTRNTSFPLFFEITLKSRYPPYFLKSSIINYKKKKKLTHIFSFF